MVDLPELLVELGVLSLQGRIPRNKSSYIWILPPVFYDSCSNGILKDIVDCILIDDCFAFVTCDDVVMGLPLPMAGSHVWAEFFAKEFGRTKLVRVW